MNCGRIATTVGKFGLFLLVIVRAATIDMTGIEWEGNDDSNPGNDNDNNNNFGGDNEELDPDFQCRLQQGLQDVMMYPAAGFSMCAK